MMNKANTSGLLLMFVAFSCFSQDYKTKFKSDMCACFESEIKVNRSNESAYNECFSKILINYASFIDAEIVEENVNTKLRKGQFARLELKTTFKYELVYSCDAYFNAVEDERQKLLSQGRLKTHQADLERANRQVAMAPSENTYINRAQIHFNLKNLKAAEADILQSMALQQFNSYIAKFLLASIFMEQERYKEASNIYAEVYSLVPNYKVAILRAIANRKAGGHFTSNKISDNELIKESDAKDSNKMKKSRRVTRGVTQENNQTQTTTKPSTRNRSRENEVSRKIEKVNSKSPTGKASEKKDLKNLFKLSPKTNKKKNN